MVWFKIDDGFWSHPKVLELSDAAVALWTRAGSYCAGHLTDGEVKRSTLRVLGADHDAAVELVMAGLWDETPAGWTFHDWAEYQPTREQVLAQRAGDNRRQELSRNPELRDAIRRRDGNDCRYCGRSVNWSDRKSAAGGTYDHIDPAGPNSLTNLVVACRGCNSRKGKRTPEQAGMTLIRSGSVFGSDLVTNQAPTRPDPTRPDPSTSDEVEEGDARGGALPSPFCSKHPEGTDGPCRACGNARMAHDLAVAAEKAKPTPLPRRPKTCAVHAEYPLPCDRCAEDAKAAS